MDTYSGGTSEAVALVYQIDGSGASDRTFGVSNKHAKSGRSVRHSSRFALVVLVLIVTKLLWAAVGRVCSSRHIRGPARNERILSATSDAAGVRLRSLYSAGSFGAFIQSLYGQTNTGSLSEAKIEGNHSGMSRRRLAGEGKEDDNHSSGDSSGGGDTTVDPVSSFCEEVLSSEDDVVEAVLAAEDLLLGVPRKSGIIIKSNNSPSLGTSEKHPHHKDAPALSTPSVTPSIPFGVSEKEDTAAGSSRDSGSSGFVGEESQTSLSRHETLEALEELIEEAFSSGRGFTSSLFWVDRMSPPPKQQRLEFPSPKGPHLDSGSQLSPNDEGPSTSERARRSLQQAYRSQEGDEGKRSKPTQPLQEQGNSPSSSGSPELPVNLTELPFSEDRLNRYVTCLEIMPQVATDVHAAKWDITPEMLGAGASSRLLRGQTLPILQLLRLPNLTVAQCREVLSRGKRLLVETLSLPVDYPGQRRNFLKHLCVTISNLYTLYKLDKLFPEIVDRASWWPMLMEKLNIRQATKLRFKTMRSLYGLDIYMQKAQEALSDFLQGSCPETKIVAELLLLYENVIYKNSLPVFE